MPHPRTLAFAMGLAFVASALALERLHLTRDGVVAAVLHVEALHLVAHSALYGALAAALASWWFPREALDAGRRSLGRRAVGAALCFACAAGAQELAQSLARERLPASEELFDLVVDVAGATLGLIAWSRADRRRVYPVARAIGVVLHPAFVGPVGVFAVTWAALRDARAGLAWTALASLAVLPVAGVWAAGLRRGWFSDADLSVRAERPRFLVVACCAALSLALTSRALDAPAAMRDIARAGLVATLLVTAVTLRGLKVSGHVAVPAGVVALLCVYSPRGVWPFAVAALALSWARVREGRHTPREVLGAWGVAGASALLARM